MKVPVIVIILLSVMCSAVAQIMLKKGMAQESVHLALQSQVSLAYASVLLEPWILGGLGLYAIGALIWLLALAHVEVSFAYPFVSLGFVMVLILGYVFFEDAVTLTRVLGTALIVAGVLVISQT